jgi:hypothetical protein
MAHNEFVAPTSQDGFGGVDMNYPPLHDIDAARDCGEPLIRLALQPYITVK